LGQIYQGRIGKGLLFLVCLYLLFFYGMYLGRWSNVFLADTAAQNPAWNLPRWATNLYNRPHFAGQFWIGIAAWPALYHYKTSPPHVDRGTFAKKDENGDYIRDENGQPVFNWGEFVRKFQAPPSEAELNELQRDSDKHWDLGWVYTIIAGVLNVLVIYDAMAGPAFGRSTESDLTEVATPKL
jgi:hypothetical protein